MNYNAATIKIYYDDHGTEVGRVCHLSGKKAVNEAFSYFPGVSSSPTGGALGSWTVAVELTFHASNGNDLLIKTNYEYWRARGDKADKRVMPGFGNYVRTLLSKLKCA